MVLQGLVSKSWAFNQPQVYGDMLWYNNISIDIWYVGPEVWEVWPYLFWFISVGLVENPQDHKICSCMVDVFVVELVCDYPLVMTNIAMENGP